MSSKKFRIAEIFGPTIQGEGNRIGTPSIFVRFGGCDYRCPPCDSPHAVLEHLVAHLPQLTEFDIAAEVNWLCRYTEPLWVVYSGGNPALLDLTDLTHMLHVSGHKIMVETQGTVYKPWLADVDDITVSPKGPGMAQGSGTETAINVIRKFLDNCVRADRLDRVSLKIVCFDKEDIFYAEDIHEAFSGVPLFLSVGNHNPGPTVGNNAQGEVAPADIPNLLKRLRWLSETVANSRYLYDARVLPQMHVLTWGNERGR